MSFSLEISGHIHDEDEAAKVDEVLRAKGAEALAELRALDLPPTTCIYSGPTGTTNFLAEPIDVDSSEVAEAPDPEGAE